LGEKPRPLETVAISQEIGPPHGFNNREGGKVRRNDGG